MAEESREINKCAGFQADSEMVGVVFDMLDMQKDKDLPIQSRKNCITVLGSDPELAGKIKYNTLSNMKNVVGVLPWNKSECMREWTNIDDEYLLYYMETYYKINSEKRVLSALDIMADTNKFNPFVDMLNSVSWDGMPRIEHLLTDYLGVKRSDYTGECMKLLMLGVISRAFSPGTKFDYILVLSGPQGIGKSSFFMKLCCNSDWYLENMKSIYDERKAAEKIQGKLIVEFNELMGMKSGVEAVKAFTTALSDEYRGAYERRSEQRKRTCVFIGTTNEPQFLNDRSGNRRFLPLECGAEPIKKSLFIDEDKLINEFKQAWAEAYEIYKSGKFSLVLSAEMKEYVDKLQVDFEEDDPLVGQIQNFLDGYDDDYVCGLIIARAVLNNDAPDMKTSKTISNIMNHKIKGWKKGGKHTFESLGRQKCYVRASEFVECEKNVFSTPPTT